MSSDILSPDQSKDLEEKPQNDRTKEQNSIEYLNLSLKTIGLISSVHLEMGIINIDQPTASISDERDYITGICDTFYWRFCEQISEEDSRKLYVKWLSIKKIEIDTDILTKTRHSRFLTNLEFASILKRFFYFSTPDDTDTEGSFDLKLLAILETFHQELQKLLLQKMAESELLLKQNPMATLDLLEKFYQKFDIEGVGHIREEMFIFLYLSMVDARLLIRPANQQSARRSLRDLTKEFCVFEGKISLRYFKLFFFNKRLITHSIVFELLKAVERQIHLFQNLKQMRKIIQDGKYLPSSKQASSLISGHIQNQEKQEISLASYFQQDAQDSLRQTEDINNLPSDLERFENIFDSSFIEAHNQAVMEQAEKNAGKNRDDQKVQIDGRIFEKDGNYDKEKSPVKETTEVGKNALKYSFSRDSSPVLRSRTATNLSELLQDNPLSLSVYYCLFDNFSPIIYWGRECGLKLSYDQLLAQLLGIYRANFVLDFLLVNEELPIHNATFVQTLIERFLKIYKQAQVNVIDYFIMKNPQDQLVQLNYLQDKNQLQQNSGFKLDKQPSNLNDKQQQQQQQFTPNKQKEQIIQQQQSQQQFQPQKFSLDLEEEGLIISSSKESLRSKESQSSLLTPIEQLSAQRKSLSQPSQIINGNNSQMKSILNSHKQVDHRSSFERDYLKKNEQKQVQGQIEQQNKLNSQLQYQQQLQQPQLQQDQSEDNKKLSHRIKHVMSFEYDSLNNNNRQSFEQSNSQYNMQSSYKKRDDRILAVPMSQELEKGGGGSAQRINHLTPGMNFSFSPAKKPLF